MKDVRILIVGPIFNSKDGPIGIGGFLYRELCKHYVKVLRVSAHRNKILRLIDTLKIVLLKKNEYDVILLQSFGLRAFVLEDLVSLCAKLLNKPISFTLHGGAFYDFFKKNPIWVRRVLNRVNLINTPSLFLQERFMEEGVGVEYIPNAISLQYFQFHRNVTTDNSLLWVRAFEYTYNPELAIYSLAILKKKYPNIKLTMVGPDRGLLSKCQKLIAELNLVDNVSIVGFVQNNELYKYYHSHTVFLTTTRYESFGVAILEAVACGIPCVSVPVGEIPYLWRNRKNIMFAERNPEDFASKIDELLENNELRDFISDNAKNNIDRFTWDRIVPLWVNTIERLNLNK